MSLSFVDFAVIGVYAVAIVTIAQLVSREKAGHKRDTEDYFLAGKALPWWAIGASLIAANISAEQIIGMSGSGYVIGLGIASYEWMAAITLMIVGKFFLPIFLKHGIYTMPQYLEQRYDASVRIIMATFWIGVYIFVNLTSVLWLGALTINTVTGLDITLALVALGLLAAAYSLYGGLKAVALTDIIQVVLLVAGGLLISYVVLDKLSAGAGPFAGFQILAEQAPQKFDMILSKDNPNYKDLPGLSVLIGGMWIMNISYWGFNQYIIQRALAAKNIREAQRGISFAAFLKLLMPVIVVVPGIAATLLAPDLEAPDKAYPTMMQYAPVGAKGLIFAALIAAILSSLGSMMNSVSTILTMDIVRKAAPSLSDRSLVTIGRVAAFAAIIIAMATARPLLGQFDQAFQYIQEFTGFFTPGIVTIFILGMFWKGANSAGALFAAIGSAGLSFAFKAYMPELPFMDRVGVVFLLCVALMVVVSIATGGSKKPHAAKLSDYDFSTSIDFNIATGIIIVILGVLYATWW